MKALNRTYLAGKTGTTNDAKDVWFVGYSADLAVGLYLGYDQPRSLGATAYAAEYAAPVFRDFMGMALKDKPDVPFRAPLGIKLISVDYRSRACARTARTRSSRRSSRARHLPTATR